MKLYVVPEKCETHTLSTDNVSLLGYWRGLIKIMIMWQQLDPRKTNHFSK